MSLFRVKYKYKYKISKNYNLLIDVLECYIFRLYISNLNLNKAINIQVFE